MLWQCSDRFVDNLDALSDAIKNLRYRQAKLLVENGSHVNARDSALRTPLILISIYLTGFDNWYNRDKFARLFLNNKADPNLCDSYGLTPLIHATINGQTDYIKVLLSYERTNYKLCDKAGNNAVMLASRYGQTQVLRLLAEHICSDEKQTPDFVDHRNYDNKTAMDLALEGNHFECVSLLKTLKDRLNQRDEQLSDGEVVTSSSHKTNKFLFIDSLKLKDSFGFQSLDKTNDMFKSKAKSFENLYQNTKSITKNGIKLPPINGKRFIGYNDWNKQNNQTDRKAICKTNE